MKKILLTTIIALILPTSVFASPVSVNRLNNDHIEPLRMSDYIKAPYFNATSTTATSVFNGYSNFAQLMTVGSNGIQFNSTGNIGDDQQTAGAFWMYSNQGINIIPGYGTGGVYDFTVRRGDNYNPLLTITSADASFAGTILGPDGDVTVPTYGFSSDDDGTGTGLFRASSNTIGFTSNGVGVGTLNGSAFSLSTPVQVNSSDDSIFVGTGDVGVGTSTPWGKLSVTNIGANPSFIVEDVTSPDTTPFVVTAVGDVGIGTVVPAKKLDVVGTLRTSGTASLSDLDIGSGWAKWNQGAAGGIGLGSGHNIVWTNTTTNTGNSGDVGLSRISAGVLGVGNGTAGNASSTLLAGIIGVGTSTPWGGAVSASSTTVTPTLVVEQKSTGQSAVFQGGAGVAIGTTTTAGEDFAVYDSAARGTISLAGLTGGEFKIAQGGIISNGYMGISYTNPKLGLTRSGSPNFLFWYNTSTGDVAMNNTFGGSSKLQLKYGDVEALAIDSGLDVGIGSSTPFARLSVTGAGTGTGKSVIVEDSAGRDIFQINDNGNVKIGSSTPTTSLLDVDGVISSGADGNIGGGEVRAYQTPGFFVTMKHDATYNLSGFFRSNTSGSKVIAGYNTSSGDTVLNSAFSATGNLMFTNLDIEMARFRTGMFSIGAGKFPAHTLDVTQPAISTAKTAAYDAIKASNTATSSTASINKAGIEIVSTGTWNGTGAKNIGVYVSSVSGGTENYDAIFNGGGHVGIGTTTPQTDLVIQGYTQSVIASGVATSTCNTAIEGSQVYNLGNHHLWLCMGSEPWTLLK